MSPSGHRRGSNGPMVDIISLLSGTEAESVNPAVEKFLADSVSRSAKFSQGEDVKLNKAHIIRNASAAALVQAEMVETENSMLTNTGAISVSSFAKTGRSPKDKRVVAEPTSQDNVWWGPVNIEMCEESFMINRERALDYLNTRKKIWVVDAYAGWDPKYRVRVRVVAERAYHALFMQNMLIKPSPEELVDFVPDLTILNAGAFPANRYVKGVTSSCSVDLHLGRCEMIILGTQYAGEMKKGVLTYMMYKMPLMGVLPLHSSANEGSTPDSLCLFFGLSGTGKTTLSADPSRALIGDDEHVWTDDGVFNIEGGCYAKCVNLSEEAEPEIFRAIKFGSVVENVVMDESSRQVDYTNISITENTRCAYPLEYIPNAKLPAVGGHPANCVLLTCDGFGCLPVVSKLSYQQVIYHFISGYTSKMAGTEQGVTSPVATFSACYGEPFLVWHPVKYAKMLAARLEKHGGVAWLLNTGWVGGKNGRRCPLKYTRAILQSIHSGDLAKQETKTEPIFGLSCAARRMTRTPPARASHPPRPQPRTLAAPPAAGGHLPFAGRYPVTCPGVPDELLDASSSWADKKAFEATSHDLARRFRNNFETKYQDSVGPEILSAGPATPPSDSLYAYPGSGSPARTRVAGAVPAS